MLVIGIDAASRQFGLACLEIGSREPKLISAKLVKLDIDDDFISRLAEVYREVLGYLTSLKPDVVAVEDVKFSPYTKNIGMITKTAYAVGTAMAAVGEYKRFEPHVRTMTLNAHEVRSALGISRSAGKEGTRRLINTRFHDDLIACGLASGVKKTGQDVSDAIALAWVTAAKINAS